MSFGWYLLFDRPNEGFLGIKSACLHNLGIEGCVMADYVVSCFACLGANSTFLGVSGPIFGCFLSYFHYPQLL